MPHKGKLRAGLEPARVVAADSEKEAIYRRHEREFNLGTLPKIILERLTSERQVEYLNMHYQRRYKRRIIWSRGDYGVCPHCLKAAYYDDGYVSDDQVRFLAGVRGGDMDELDKTYPGLKAEVYSLNGLKL